MIKYPFDDILPRVTIVPSSQNEILIANVDGARSITSDQLSTTKTFKTIVINNRGKALIIHGKRWYFRLVSSDNNYRSRALMDEYQLNDISQHLVICFTPDYIPGSSTRFLTKEGKLGRIYAFFESYVEFYHYIQHFSMEERAFYEIIFGELPQKPHFDIDLDLDKLTNIYPNEDIINVSELIKDAVITGCIQVFQDHQVNLDISRDILLYSSHGSTKRSYHLVINNKCHDGNKESKAFYTAVMGKISIITQQKYLVFVDHSVYSPRQQFRMIRCQKQQSNRPKIFHEQFIYQGIQYQHIYNEDILDPLIKELTELYESMVGFTAGCICLPSLIPPRAFNHHDLGAMADIDDNTIQYCMNLLQTKMAATTFTINNIKITPTCPFSVRSVKGHLILLKREGTSYCPICKCSPPHEAEHPYIFIINGRIYWDCRRSEDKPKLLLGYLAMTFEELQAGSTFSTITEILDEDEGGEFMFGDFNMGEPTLSPTKKIVSKPNSPPVINPSINNNPIITIAPEYRLQNLEDRTMKIAREWAIKKAQKIDQYYQQSIIVISNGDNSELVWPDYK